MSLARWSSYPDSELLGAADELVQKLPAQSGARALLEAMTYRLRLLYADLDLAAASFEPAPKGRPKKKTG